MTQNSDNAIDWLLDGDPAIRWQVLRDVVGAADGAVERERRKVARDGWGARLLAWQDREGTWAGGLSSDGGLYHPKWTSTTYTMLLLRDFGLAATNRQARKACALLLEQGMQRDGGINYGWNIMEGTECFRSDDCDEAGLTLPVLEYDHGEGCSVTGGHVYRGGALPDLEGLYFYSDFCSGFVRSFRLAGGAALEGRSWPELEPGGSVTSFGEDVDGELYILTREGSVFEIVPGE